jgi:hypothetical protein
MAETGVLFITQNMVIGNDRNTVVFLSIQAAYPRQAITDTDLEPGLIQAIFELIQDGITQVTAERTKWRATAVWRVVDWGIFPGDQVLIA